MPPKGKAVSKGPRLTDRYGVSPVWLGMNLGQQLLEECESSFVW